MAIRFLIYKKDLIHVLFLTFLVSGKSRVFFSLQSFSQTMSKTLWFYGKFQVLILTTKKFITLFKIMTLVASSNKINLSVSIGWFSCPFLTTKFICNKGFRSDSVGTYIFLINVFNTSYKLSFDECN